MDLNQRKNAFEQLGSLFESVVCSYNNTKISYPENPIVEGFKLLIDRAHESNGWFTKENVLFALSCWSESLQKENLDKWTAMYDLSSVRTSKKVGIIMAGNIPLVGFHDFLSVLLCGHMVVIKLSSNDRYFIPFISKYLASIDPWFASNIQFSNEKLPKIDAVIATGSNNTVRYFEHYFSKYANILRKNRNGVAILTGNETKEDLEQLGEDIFRYFGLGCRSVSKIFVPVGYDFDKLFNALYKYKDIINYKKYENNYDYNKAVYLMSLFELVENGFLMLKEDNNYGSPIATLFYEYYDSMDQLKKKLSADKDQIQCIVSNENVVDFVKFGHSQRPKLWNYADDIDTIEFLLNI